MSWQAAAYAIVALTVLAGFAWWERSRPPAKLLSLVAALAALAVLGRLAFTPIPNVKPTTDIAIFSGYALGALPGFVVGATAALVSNFALGQGPWTPWEMAAWGITGVLGAGLARVAGRELGRWPLALFCAAMGFLYGAIMDLFQTTVVGLQGIGGWLTVSGTSFTFNLAHAVGNVAFCLLIGPSFVHAIGRFRRRFTVHWQTPAAVAGALLVVASALAAQPPRAEAASNTQRALSYVERAQNSDGGFGAAPGQSSGQLYTGWAALGIAAAGANPSSVSAHGASPIAYISDRAGQLNDIGELERTILVLATSGASPRSFRGRDLVAELVRRRKSNGSFDGTIDHAAFGILALRAAGASGVGKTAAWIARYQNRDGGFGFAPHGGSDPDDTGSVMQALAAAARRGPISKAVGYLKRAQNRDGGFGQFDGTPSNAQSTAFAVQGLVAAGGDPSRAIRYLRSLQTSSGMVRYSRSSSQTPVWVTSEALLAFARKPFPFHAPGRAAEHRRAAATASGSAAAKPKRRAKAAETKPKPQPKAAAPVAPKPSPRETPLTRARSVSASKSGTSSQPWLLWLAVSTLPLVGLEIWRRRRSTAG
ncbi:MAG: prenyltransferase/squalene oxidase repeat-containing protein [Thermoleophilaceae bacterium]